MHHSRESRETPVQCRGCRKPTTEFDMVCADCAIARATPACTETYFQFDLDIQRVHVPEFRLDPADVMAELTAVLDPLKPTRPAAGTLRRAPHGSGRRLPTLALAAWVTGLCAAVATGIDACGLVVS